MNSLYIYNEKYFLSKKPDIESIHENGDLKKILKDIYNKYPCFSDTVYIRKSSYNNNNNNNNNNNKYKSKKSYKHNTFKETSEITRLKRKTDIQIILGYLNKLTSKNYDILSEKITENISEDNYIEILNKLFEISYKQASYSDLYIGLYKKIITTSDNKLFNNYIILQITNIIFNKNDELTLIDKHIDKVKLDYNDFCDINKNAKYLKGKINIISKLIKNNIIDLKQSILIDNLFKYENYENEIFLELLQIINNILKLDKDKIKVLQNYVDTSNFKGKMMLKFKLKDIISNKLTKPF